jgi:hypothetical protein
MLFIKTFFKSGIMKQMVELNSSNLSNELLNFIAFQAVHMM